ncbi:Os04g0320150 [Oryza sativa Japonica Group]|uniref:Os04g0320150 protein n=1 Tax=Oryza sativa subsp. japonica TaxID=39947 RepID=A0A0P0W8H9_ORYSJ|nr:Os04g0320150 [Oryza sativa Japonica Group]
MSLEIGRQVPRMGHRRFVDECQPSIQTVVVLDDYGAVKMRGWYVGGVGAAVEERTEGGKDGVGGENLSLRKRNETDIHLHW